MNRTINQVIIFGFFFFFFSSWILFAGYVVIILSFGIAFQVGVVLEIASKICDSFVLLQSLCCS